MLIYISSRWFPRVLRLTVLLLLLGLFQPAFAGVDDSRRHSLIHRPRSHSALPTKPESRLHQSRPSKRPLSPATASLPRHHKLTKKLTVLSTTLRPTASIASTASSQRSIPPSSSGPAQSQTIPATRAKPLINTTARPIATASILSSLTGATVVSPTRTPSAARSVAAASSGAPAPQLPGSMQRLLQANPSFTTLLQAPTPVGPTTPPPSRTSSPPPPSTTTGSARLTWAANGEPDLAGYKVYVGTASGTYDLSGSPFTLNTVTTYTVTNLPWNNTYFFAISAYDTSGNESPLSAEVSKSIF